MSFAAKGLVLLVSLAVWSAARCEPLEADPLLRRAAAAGQTGGKGAVERLLVDAALEDGDSPMPWVGLGMLHSQSQNDKEAASTLWAALERLHRRLQQLTKAGSHKRLERGGGSSERIQNVEAHIQQVSMWTQASLSKPPTCARFLCPAASNDVREVTEQVSICLPAEPAVEFLQSIHHQAEVTTPHEREVREHAWPEGLTPFIDRLDGPATIAPLREGGHLMVAEQSMVSEQQHAGRQDGGSGRPPLRCAVWPAEHLAFRLFSDLRSQPELLRTPAAVDGGDVVELREGEMVGSTLGALDTRNFFHFVREGIAPLLLLQAARLPAMLLPDNGRWRAWAAALRPVEGPAPELRFVRPDATVVVPRGSAVHFIDVRRAPTEASPFDVGWLAEMSGAALLLVRNAFARLPTPPAASCTGGAAESTDAATGGATELAADGTGGAARVVYISRNDSSVRRVLREGRLLEALQAAARVDGWVLEPVLLSELSLEATRALLQRAAAVVGPHGAGLFNAPLFAPSRCALVPFGLREAEADKESNLRAVCQAVGMRFLSPQGVTGPFGGNYTLGDRHRAAVVASVREALRKR